MAGANWVDQVNTKLNEMNSDPEKEKEDWKKRSIYKLTTSITDLNKKAYIPQYVSFGPYHHGEDHLQPMEEHKERALLHFLKRANKPLQSLIDCLKEVAEDLKSSYAVLPTKWQEDDIFIRLMILDGCFMLEFMQQNITEQPLDYYADDDPIFSREGTIRMMPHVVGDMLMLENQLPMLVLEKLFDFGGGKKDDEHLNQLILKSTPDITTEKPLGKCLHVLDVYRKNLLQGGGEGSDHKDDDEHLNQPTLKSTDMTTKKPLGKCLHVLDVYRKNLLKGEQSQRGGEGSGSNISIPTATELNLAGIRFMTSETKSLEDISFNGGTLKLPPILVHGSTESIFLNLIAYERYHIGTGNQEITSYIYLMDCVIDSEKDVALLKSSKIIQHMMASDKDVAELFNSLAEGTTLYPDSKLSKILYNVQNQYEKPWIVWRTNLSRIVETFRNRWAFLSLVAAVCLFAIAITQTVYTISAYYKNDSPPTPPAVPPATPMIPPPPPVISRRLSSYRHP